LENTLGYKLEMNSVSLRPMALQSLDVVN